MPPPDDFDAIERRFGGATAAPAAADFDAIEAKFGQLSGVRAAIFGDAGTEAALPLSDDDKAAYIKRLFPGQDYDPGSEVLSPEEQQRIFADYKREPYVVGAGGADPEFTRRTSVAAFDKLFGPRTVGERQQIEEILAKHAPKEASAGERAQYLGGQFMEGMNAPAMGYARRLFGRGGALENPASLEAAENVANPSRKSIGDGRFEEVRKDVESTFVGRTLSGAANLAGATPGLLATGAALTKPTVLGVANPLAKVVPPMAAGPTALGLNALASSGGDVAAAGEGVAFGAIAGALSLPLKQYIASLPIALQSKAVDRLATMAAGGLEFAAADAILHGPDGERALTNFIFGAGMKAVGTSPGQARAKELTTSREVYPDPVEAAPGVREGYDRRLAEVESARSATPAIDPVAEAKATAAEFDAKVAPESAAAEKPVSVAPVAPIEAQAKPPAPDAPASKTLVGTDKRVVTADDLPDARGSAETKWYHGTGAKDLNPQVLDTIGSSDPNSLVGMGLYLTDSPQIAETYAAARGRRTGTPTVYEAQVAPRNVINFEKPLPPQVAETMARAAGGLSETAGQYVKDAIANGKSGMEVYKAMREGLIYDEIPLSEATETLQTLQGQLRDLGYDAISHIGGLRAGKGENLHRVLVVLDPNYGYSRDGKFVQPYENPVRSFAPKASSHPQEVAEAKASAQGAAIEPKAEAPKPVEPDPWTLTPEQFKARYGGDASDWAAVVRNGIEIFNATNIPPEVRRTYDEQTAARNAKSKAAKDAYDASQRDEYLYHVAPASRAGRIESEGLRPNAGATVRGGSYEGYSKGKVFLTEKGGIDFWKDRVSRHLEDQGLPSDVTVYRVKRSDVPDAKPDAIGSKDATKPAYYADRPIRVEPVATAEASKPPAPEARPMEAAPKPADVVRELTAQPAETSMFAGGPESISTKAYEAWTATREGFRGAIKGLKDFFSSQKAPELLRLSPRAWRGVVAAESAPQIAKAAVKVWEAEVPNPSWSPKERVQFEAALTENNRLGAVDNRIADAEAKRTEAQALREQAATLNGSAAADALLKKATRLDREALVFDERAKRAEGKNEYLIGEGKPFASQAELAEFVSRPDVVEAAKRHQAWWSEMVEPSYKSAQSIEGTEAMPTRGRFFDSRASLVVPPEGEATTGVAGSKAGQTENIKTRRSKFAHLAWGDSSRGYEVEANKYLKKALEDVVPKGGWRDAVDSLVREGHGVRLTKPDQQKPTEIAGEPAVKFDIGQQGERVYLPKSLHETLTHIRQVGAATHIKGFSDLAKTATHQAMSMAKDNIFVMARAISRVMTLPSTGRPALEIAGNVALWPVMRVIDIANLGARALGYMKASPRERLAMGTAGVAEREPMLKRDSKGRVETDAQGNPIEIDANLPGLKWLGPVSNAIDTAARESLVTTMRRLKANGVNIDTSPEAMSKYVGQLGRYGRAWYGAIQRIFTDSGANPFFESRRTSRGNALRMMAANPNLTPLDTGTALKLRGVVLSKLVGLMTTTAIANVLTTGDVLGGPSTPVGAISLGKDKDGKRIFLDFWKLMGIRQVARATGIEQALEGLRRGDDAGQVALSALTGAGREAAGFASGPLPTALSIGATGSRPDQLIGGQTDASIPAAVDPATLTRRRAVEGAKAALPLVGEGAELFAKWFGGENIKDILNAGTEVTPDMIDEFVNLRNTVGVGVGQTDAQASTLHDRSNKGFFFGTYLDAVKEDLRRASPDKVQAIVDKAWRDIDTRDDLSAGDKKKAKSAIQYYARNRRLLMGGR